MKYQNHVIVLTIDLDAMAKGTMAALKCISQWIYYTICGLVDAMAFYGPIAWRAAKRYAYHLKRYICFIIRCSEHAIIFIVDKIALLGMFIIFLMAYFYRKGGAWFSDAWAFRAAVLAECR